MEITKSGPSGRWRLKISRDGIFVGYEPKTDGPPYTEHACLFEWRDLARADG